MPRQLSRIALLGFLALTFSAPAFAISAASTLHGCIATEATQLLSSTRFKDLKIKSVKWSYRIQGCYGLIPIEGFSYYKIEAQDSKGNPVSGEAVLGEYGDYADSMANDAFRTAHHGEKVCSFANLSLYDAKHHLLLDNNGMTWLYNRGNEAVSGSVVEQNARSDAFAKQAQEYRSTLVPADPEKPSSSVKTVE